MESPVRTSFIPKQSVQPATTSLRRARTGTVGLLTVLAVVILVGTIIAAGLLFLYKQYLDRDLTDKAASLDKAKQAFDPALLEELSRLDNRLGAANTLLVSHSALSLLLDFLEKNTMQTVRFTSFKFQPGTTGVGSVAIALTGQAKSFGSVALQADIFGKAKILQTPIFNGLNLDPDGNVIFNVKADINMKELLFAKTLGPEPDTVSTVNDAGTSLSSTDVPATDLSDEALFGETATTTKKTGI